MGVLWDMIVTNTAPVLTSPAVRRISQKLAKSESCWSKVMTEVQPISIWHSVTLANLTFTQPTKEPQPAAGEVHRRHFYLMISSANKWSKNFDIRPHRHCTRTIQSYSPGFKYTPISLGTVPVLPPAESLWVYRLPPGLNPFCPQKWSFMDCWNGTL